MHPPMALELPLPQVSQSRIVEQTVHLVPKIVLAVLTFAALVVPPMAILLRASVSSRSSLRRSSTSASTRARASPGLTFSTDAMAFRR